MTALLVTGSRDATAAMLVYVDRLVERAAILGWSIIVGDAEGVDARVVANCCAMGVPFVCYGITEKPRHFCCDDHLDNYIQVPGNYLARDRKMCEHADRVMAIWNGHSRGTKYTYDYALKIGKQADCRRFPSAGSS